MKETTLKQLKTGDWFTYRPIAEPDESHVYVRGEYNRSIKRYSVTRYNDINVETHRKGSTVVYVDFTF